MDSLKSRINSVLDNIACIDSIENNSIKEILLNLTNIVSELTIEVEKIKESQTEINEYVTILDENLGNIEDELYGFEEEDEEFNSFDYIDVCCKRCNEILAVEKTLVNSENEILCPNCHNSINL